MLTVNYNELYCAECWELADDCSCWAGEQRARIAALETKYADLQKINLGLVEANARLIQEKALVDANSRQLGKALEEQDDLIDVLRESLKFSESR